MKIKGIFVSFQHEFALGIGSLDPAESVPSIKVSLPSVAVCILFEVFASSSELIDFIEQRVPEETWHSFASANGTGHERPGTPIFKGGEPVVEEPASSGHQEHGNLECNQHHPCVEVASDEVTDFCSNGAVVLYVCAAWSELRHECSSSKHFSGRNGH